jgi:hypothetical protein
MPVGPILISATVVSVFLVLVVLMWGRFQSRTPRQHLANATRRRRRSF